MEVIAIKILLTSIVTLLVSFGVMKWFDYDEIPKIVSASVILLALASLFVAVSSTIAIIWLK